MDEANPIIIVLMFVLRCLVPLAIMLGISYLLRWLGLIKPPPSPPDGSNSDGNNHTPTGGDLAHGKA